jgi:hypothetical protein
MADDTRDDDREVELPPAFLKFQAQLKADRKMLLRDKAYGQSAEQLRAFIAQYVFQRLNESVQLMGLAIYDTYGLAVSSENQIQRMRAVYGKALAKLGADVDEKGELPGVSPEVLDEFQQNFYALGTLLQAKLPDDKDVQTAFNKCAEVLGDMVADLLGEDDEDDEDDDEDDEDDDEDDEDDDDEDEGSDKKSKKSKKKPEAEAEAAPDVKPAGDASDV